MERRNFLFTCGTIATVSMAGCTTPGKDKNPPDESSPNETPNENPTPEKSLTVTNHSFEKLESAPAEPMIQSAENGEYVIEGTMDVKDGCTTIALLEAPVMGDSDPLTVNVKIATEDTGGDMCTQAIRSIGYRLTISTEGDAAEEFQISHGGVNSEVVTLTVDES